VKPSARPVKCAKGDPHGVLIAAADYMNQLQQRLPLLNITQPRVNFQQPTDVREADSVNWGERTALLQEPSNARPESSAGYAGVPVDTGVKDFPSSRGAWTSDFERPANKAAMHFRGGLGR